MSPSDTRPASSASAARSEGTRSSAARHTIQRINQSVGGIPGDDIHLVFLERAVNQTQIHHVRLDGKAQMVSLRPSPVAVGALEEFVPHADAPARRNGRNVGYRAQMFAAGVFAAHHHREGVVEAERLGHFEAKPLGVSGLYPAIHRSRRRSRIFGVKVNLPRAQGLMTHQRAAKIHFAFDGDAGARLDVLGEKLGEDDLLRKILRSDNQPRPSTAVAPGKKRAQTNEDSRGAAPHLISPPSAAPPSPGSRRPVSPAAPPGSLPPESLDHSPSKRRER